MGTMLLARGLQHGRPPEDFTLTQPEVVGAIHAAYAEAGATVHKTNTFNANRIRLEHTGIADAWERMNRRAVELARSAARPGAGIAGVIGPTGMHLSAADSRQSDTIRAALAAQASALADAGADLLLVETMYDLREARIALSACRSVCSLPVIVSLTFTRTPRGFLTQVGDAAGDALRALLDDGADAVGTNCNLDGAVIVGLARRMREYLPEARLLIQPCAGQPRATASGMEYPDTPEDFAQCLAPLAGLGIQMLGGCCGTTPAHIHQLIAGLRQAGGADPA